MPNTLLLDFKTGAPSLNTVSFRICRNDLCCKITEPLQKRWLSTFFLPFPFGEQNSGGDSFQPFHIYGKIEYFLPLQIKVRPVPQPFFIYSRNFEESFLLTFFSFFCTS